MADETRTTICNCRQRGLGGDCDGSCQHPQTLNGGCPPNWISPTTLNVPLTPQRRVAVEDFERTMKEATRDAES